MVSTIDHLDIIAFFGVLFGDMYLNFIRLKHPILDVHIGYCCGAVLVRRRQHVLVMEGVELKET